MALGSSAGSRALAVVDPVRVHNASLKNAPAAYILEARSDSRIICASSKNLPTIRVMSSELVMLNAYSITSVQLLSQL